MTTSWYKLELAVWHQLEADGYLCRRAPGSKGKSDITALKPLSDYGLGQVEILFVQAKETDLIPPADRAALLRLGRMFGATALWARWGNGGPRGGRTVEFRELTGPGPKDWRPWTADHQIGADK